MARFYRVDSVETVGNVTVTKATIIRKPSNTFIAKRKLICEMNNRHFDEKFYEKDGWTDKFKMKNTLSI